jgi:outer membrane protein
MNYKMRILKNASFVFSLAVLSTSAHAQGERSLSLNEAINLGVQNSKQLKISKAKIDAAISSLQESKDRRLPDLSVSGSYLRVAKPTINLLINLSSGSGSSGSTPSVDQAMYGMANASIPLFDGFKNHAAIESAKYLQKAVTLDAETDRQQVVQNIVAAYSNLYKANAAVNLVKENLKQSHQRSTDFSNLEQNGLLARNDLLKAQLQESNIQLSLLDAESNLRVANINMDLMLGLPEMTSLQLDSSSFSSSNDPQTLSHWESLAFDNRTDFQSLAYHEKSAKAGIQSARSAYYPTIRLTGGYLALNVPNAIQVSDAWNAGVGLSYNVSSLWKTGASVSSAKAQLQQVQASQEMLNDNIKVQINQAYEAYFLSLKKIDVYAQAVEQANENYKILKNKYDNSLATTTDLLDADVQQLQAKLNYAYSKADAIVAYNKLLQTAGVIAK